MSDETAAEETGSETQTFTQADIDRIVSERITRERQKFADYNDLKSKAAKYEQTVASQQTETEKAVAAARKEAETAVRAEMLRDRVLDRVEALAAKDFEDAEDAKLRLAGRADEFAPNGEIDSDAIKAALAALLAEKPHLAARGDGRPRGDVNQGPRLTTTARDPAEQFAKALQGHL